MSEYFWARIKIGGALNPADTEKFIRTAGISRHGIHRHVDGNGIFIKEDDMAAFGRFEALEKLCLELNLPFIRESDGLGEFPPEIVFWIPGMEKPCAALTDSMGEMVVSMDVMVSIRDALLRDDLADAVWQLDRHIVELPEIPAFELRDQEKEGKEVLNSETD